MLHESIGSNLSAQVVQSKGDYEAIRESADLLVARRFLYDRGVAAAIENRGVAPFYAAWPIEWGLLDGRTGELRRSVEGGGGLTGILPGGEPVRRVGRIAVDGLAAGTYVLAMRVANPMPGGLPLRFANGTQDQHAPGWLSLMEVRIP